MKKNNDFGTSWCLALILIVSVVGPALADESTSPEVDGVFGMEIPGEAAWLAVRVEIPEGKALAGLTWYNNDGATVFEQLLVGTGYEESPGDIGEFLAVAHDVQGMASEWCEVALEMPVVASLGSLYVVFVLPASEVLTGRGQGGGPGIGYCSAELGQPGWLGGGDDVWAKLHESYGFAVIPEFVTATPGMAVKSLQREGTDIDVVKPYLAVGPNPFNPMIEIRFGMNERSRVNLEIYDLRGRRVRRLIDDVMDRGEHQVAWNGRDGAGRGMASGVYCIRLSTGSAEYLRRVTLVR